MKSWHILVAFAPWVVAGVLFFTAPPPFDDLGGDSVEPSQVSPGGSVTVTRNLRVRDETPMRVSRVMIKGDCKKSCDVIDLPTSALTLKQGDQFGIRRPHIIPAHASAGTWRLVFTIHWDDFIGRERRARLKELTIEVVR